jgi:hypothetical protein
MQKESKPKRVSVVLRNDLSERVFQKAKELGQNIEAMGLLHAISELHKLKG